MLASTGGMRASRQRLRLSMPRRLSGPSATCTWVCWLRRRGGRGALPMAACACKRAAAAARCHTAAVTAAQPPPDSAQHPPTQAGLAEQAYGWYWDGNDKEAACSGEKHARLLHRLLPPTEVSAPATAPSAPRRRAERWGANAARAAAVCRPSMAGPQTAAACTLLAAQRSARLSRAGRER